MAGPMKKSHGAGFPPLGLIAGGRKALRHGLVHESAINVGTDHLGRALLGGSDGAHESLLGLRGTAFEVGARHVPKITSFHDPGKNIDDDEFLGPQWTKAPFMRIAGLVPACDNGILRVAALFMNSGFEGEAQTLRGQGLALIEQGAPLDLGGAQDFFRDSIADGAEAIAFADASRFPR